MRIKYRRNKGQGNQKSDRLSQLVNHSLNRAVLNTTALRMDWIVKVVKSGIRDDEDRS